MEQNEENKDQQNNQQGGADNNKDHKNFLSVVGQIFGLIGADPQKGTKAPIFTGKVANDKVAGVMEKLTAKRQEKALETFEGEMDGLLNDYATFQQESAKRKKAFEQAELEKEKEFTKKAQAVLGRVQDMGGWFQAYQKGLNVLAGAPGQDNNNQQQP